MKDEILKYFPTRIQKFLNNLSDEIWSKLEEIRVSIDKPLILCGNNFSAFLKENSHITDLPEESVIVSEKEILCIIEMITEGSVYAVTDKIKNGYIVLPCGHRVGITGTTVIENNRIKFIKNISSLNFRIRREIKGVSDKIIPYIYDKASVKNTLIIAPPRCGKTTLLRDISRVLANNINKIKVSIVDERGEIAAVYNGVPQNDVGVYANVLDMCPKSQGMMLLVRSMSPDVIITDEIGGQDDIYTLQDISRCGINIITTIHGFDINDVPLELQAFFNVFIVLSKRNGTGTIEKIIKGGGDTCLKSSE